MLALLMTEELEAPAVVAVTGEPGVGKGGVLAAVKSRLFVEAPGRVVCSTQVGRSTSGGSSNPYSAMRELSRQLQRSIRGEAPAEASDEAGSGLILDDTGRGCEVSALFKGLLWEASETKGQRLVVVIHGADRFEEPYASSSTVSAEILNGKPPPNKVDELAQGALEAVSQRDADAEGRSRGLMWLPDPMPPGVTVLLSCSGGGGIIAGISGTKGEWGSLWASSVSIPFFEGSKGGSCAERGEDRSGREDRA